MRSLRTGYCLRSISPYIHYAVSQAEEIGSYLSEERRLLLEGVGKVIVNAELFTTQDKELVTFEEFKIFCDSYGLNAYQEAARIDRQAFLQM